MIWKIIGQSVIGTSHIQSGKTCEDSLHYTVFPISEGEEGLICFVSDGAGSAKYAAKASAAAVNKGVEFAQDIMTNEIELNDQNLLQLAEKIYDHLNSLALEEREPKNEFSCTLLGFILLPNRAGFIQIGDGAIVRSDESDFFTPIWWPQNGEYQNSTTFLIDDPNLSNLKTKIIEERISEIGIFTDGLQMLTLNNETESVHQPFFNNLFPWLRKAKEAEHISILNNKLIEYLSGDIINRRTDDDKTLLLATRKK
ncbi:PP2C family serine/threonine-protein phosphatase [Pedobacter gandavensis]|uniref:PP2C family serine/threonine-protein phosphatase n=1 Tax=Pedobacter gandavensis TaxID=2679963 RepID=UPI00292F4CBC|nr:PP2C family serine/threonine-protein phosphatase [Pedobacter gandavensis]